MTLLFKVVLLPGSVRLKMTKENEMPEFVLWGVHKMHGERPIKIFQGSLRDCRSRFKQRTKDGGWTLAIYTIGTLPVGLAQGAAK